MLPFGTSDVFDDGPVTVRLPGRRLGVTDRERQRPGSASSRMVWSVMFEIVGAVFDASS